MTNPIPQITIQDDKPIIAGTNITIEQILAALVRGDTHAAILTQYPDVSEDDIRAVLQYAMDAVQQVDPALILQPETDDDDDEDSLEDIKAGFLQGWHEAMTGVKGIPVDQLWDAIDDE